MAITFLFGGSKSSHEIFPNVVTVFITRIFPHQKSRSKLGQLTFIWANNGLLPCVYLLQIRALSAVLQRPLEVTQADTPPVVSGEEYQNQPLVLPYFRHAFGLGEHYNSVRPLTAEDYSESEDR